MLFALLVILLTQFCAGHTQDIRCMSVHPNKLLIATGQGAGVDRAHVRWALYHQIVETAFVHEITRWGWCPRTGEGQRLVSMETNKLKCQFYLPTGSHLTQISAGVPNLDETLNLNNFGQNGQNWKIFVAIIKPARWGFRGKKSFFWFRPFLTA